MGRPMRQVDPAAGPVQQFAAGLRELREQAGNLFDEGEVIRLRPIG